MTSCYFIKSIKTLLSLLLIVSLVSLEQHPPLSVMTVCDQQRAPKPQGPHTSVEWCYRTAPLHRPHFPNCPVSGPLFPEARMTVLCVSVLWVVKLPNPNKIPIPSSHTSVTWAQLSVIICDKCIYISRLFEHTSVLLHFDIIIIFCPGLAAPCPPPTPRPCLG